MNLSENQKNILDKPLGLNLLIEGYTGVGKTTILLKKYEQIIKNHMISRNKIIFVVSDEIKKQINLNRYFLLSANYNLLNIYTINELIHRYLAMMDLPLFNNTISKDDKRAILDGLIHDNPEIKYTVDFLNEEINFIQTFICIKDDNELEETLKKELKKYLMIPRKSTNKGLLSFKEKQNIWSLYHQYLKKVLSEDIFDEETFYQSFLRLIYHQFDENELAMNFTHIFIDDVQDFTKVQLDIIYYLFDRDEQNASYYLALDDLKAKDRYRNYKYADVFQHLDHTVTLDVNYRNSHNVFNLISSYLNNNELISQELPYTSQKEPCLCKSVLTYYYNKKVNEKQEVFFDRINFLVTNLDYTYKDILVVFACQDNMEEITQQCEIQNIPVGDIYQHLESIEINALTFIHKSELISVEFKVVILYDADDKKLCTGPINKIINIQNNYIDSLSFYLALGNATDFLIINSSVSEPSHLLLPSKIDYRQFVFDTCSKFEIKSTLNVYRISEFIAYIKHNLCTYYGYSLTDLQTHKIFDICIKLDENSIGIKILDNNIDDDTINYILNNSEDFKYIVIFDSHHYLTFQKTNKEFERIIDIPNKTNER